MKKLLAVLALVIVTVTPLKAQQWTMSSDTNAINDAVSVFASVDAVKGTNDTGRPYALLVACEEHHLVVAVVWDDVISPTYRWVAWRVDSAKAVSEEWAIPESHEASRFPAGNGIRSFLDKLMYSQRFVVQTLNWQGYQLTATFDMTEAPLPIARVIAACR